MRVKFPDNGWADLRTDLKARDKFAVQGAVSVRVDDDGRAGQEFSGSVMTLMETALAARLLQKWSLDAPLPGAHSCAECAGNSRLWHLHVADYTGEALTLAQWNAISAVVSPLLEQVMETPNPVTSPASGGSS